MFSVLVLDRYSGGSTSRQAHCNIRLLRRPLTPSSRVTSASLSSWPMGFHQYLKGGCHDLLTDSGIHFLERLLKFIFPMNDGMVRPSNVDG